MIKRALIIAVLIFAASPATADDADVIFVKSLTAKQYDKALPSVPVEQWLAYNLPRGVDVVWGKHVTDRGEQTGIPEMDKVRDMPLCAEIELRKEGELTGYLLLFVGTEKKGKMKNAGLYFGFFKQ